MISAFLDILIYFLTNISIIFGFKRPPISLRCLTGKTAIVTGGNAGIGFAIATKLASRGCKVILADYQNGELSRDRIITSTGNMDIVYKYVDLSSLDSVRSFASDICRTEAKIDILINNAGIGITSKKVSEDGLNYVMQVNIFGAFLLTHLLLDPLKKSGSAQVIFTSSMAVFLHSLTLKSLNPTDIQMDHNFQILYSNSKVCNILVAQESAKRLKKYGITVNAIDPIAVSTQIFDTLPYFNVLAPILKIGLFFIGQSRRKVASSYLYVITKNGSNIPTGENYVLSSIGKKPKILQDRQFCEDVWSKLEDLVKLRPEEIISK